MVEIAKYDGYGSIIAIIDGVEVAIPDDMGNRYRIMIAEWVAKGNEVEPYIPTPAPLPNLTARQLRLGLNSLGKLAVVEAAINQLPDPTKGEAKIEWEFASTFRRDHPLILQISPILGLSDEQIDAVWLEYSTV